MIEEIKQFMKLLSNACQGIFYEFIKIYFIDIENKLLTHWPPPSLNLNMITQTLNISRLISFKERQKFPQFTTA